MRLSLVVLEMLDRLALNLKRGFLCGRLDPETGLTLNFQDCLPSNLKMLGVQDCLSLGLKRRFAYQHLVPVSVLHQGLLVMEQALHYQQYWVV